MIENCKWQWMDNRCGPMGWFSDAEKKKHEGTEEFTNGHWRKLGQQEITSMVRSIGRLAYEQS